MRTLADEQDQTHVSLDGCTVVIDDGRAAKTETWPNPFRARVEYDRAILERLGKGMHERFESSSANEDPSPPIDTPATAGTKTIGVPELRPLRTGKRDTTAVIKRLLNRRDNPWKALQQELTTFESARIVPHLAEVLRLATEPLATGQLDPLARNERGMLLRCTAIALVAHRDEPQAVAALAQVLETHPSRWVRATVGLGVCDAHGPVELTRHLTRFLDRDVPWQEAHRYLMTGAMAGVLVDPPTAWDRLSPFLASDDLLLPFHVFILRTGHIVRAASNHCDEVDPRWWEAVAPYFLHPDLSSSASQLFETALAAKAHRPWREAQDAVVGQLAWVVEEDTPPPWSPLIGAASHRPGDSRTPPLVMQALERRLGQGPIEAERFALERIGDASCVEPLRRLRDGAERDEDRNALDGLIDQLGSTKTTRAVGLDAEFSQRRVTQLLALLQPTVVLAPRKKRSRALPVGASRIGGEPDLPDDVAWPFFRERDASRWQALRDESPNAELIEKDGSLIAPLAFIAQIDLATVAQQDPDRLIADRLPRAGMLWLFANDDLIVETSGDLMHAACTVIHRATPGPLSRRPWPKEVSESHRHRPALLGVAIEMRLPYHHNAVVSALGLTLKESERYYAVMESAYHGGHQMLGYAECAYYNGLPPDGQELLFQAASGSVSDRALFFCAPDGQSGRSAFDDTICLIDEL